MPSFLMPSFLMSSFPPHPPSLSPPLMPTLSCSSYVAPYTFAIFVLYPVLIYPPLLSYPSMLHHVLPLFHCSTSYAPFHIFSSSEPVLLYFPLLPQPHHPHHPFSLTLDMYSHIILITLMIFYMVCLTLSYRVNVICIDYSRDL